MANSIINSALIVRLVLLLNIGLTQKLIELKIAINSLQNNSPGKFLGLCSDRKIALYDV